MPSNPHFSSWKRKIIPKEKLRSVLALNPSDPNGPAAEFCSNVETNLQWHVVALMENDSRRVSVEIQADC